MKFKIWSGLALFCAFSHLDPASALAANTASAAKDDSEYNFSWLDPDKKIYVLQNRRYPKAGAVQLSALGGMSLGDTYRTVIQAQPRLAYWWSESMGVEVFYSARANYLNNPYLALEQTINSGGLTSSPHIREIKSQFGLLFNWAPWYAKINVFNSILYFDWYFSLGLGTLGTNIGPKRKDDAASAALWTTENLFAVFLGTGHIFHLDEHWKIRLDFLGHFYSAGIYTGITGVNVPTDKAIYSNFAINAGVGYSL